METSLKIKSYNSELRALLSLRNFNKVLESHYEQMLQIENNLAAANSNALAIIEANCSPASIEKWREYSNEINSSLTFINQQLKIAKEKIQNKERTNSSQLFTRLDLHLNDLKTAYKNAEEFGFEILPESEHIHWRKDICNYEAVILPLIISHAEACRLELEIIEKYTPKELHVVTQIIADHIPEEFTFEEADKYEKDYLKAVQDFKKELSGEKNLWDKFLDILAGGTHQPPSERVMLQRWIEGEKHDL